MTDNLNVSNQLLSNKASGVYSGVAIRKIQWDATCGDTTLATPFTSELVGEISRIIFIPNSVAGAWDAYLYDEDGIDLLSGNGESRSHTEATHLVGATLPAVTSPIRLFCSGLVAGDDITVKVLIK